MKVVELFCGIGGFRLGLEKANQISVDSQPRIRNEKGQCEPCVERGNGRQFQELRYSSHKQVADSNTPQGSSSIKKRSKSQLPARYRCVWSNDNNKYACQIYRKHYGTEELVEADIKTINPNTIPDHDLLTAGFPCQAFSVAGKRKGFSDTRGTLFYDIARVAEAKRPRLLLLENVKGLLSHDEGLTFQIILESLEELGYLVEWQVLNSKHFGVPQNRERVFIVGHLRGGGSKQIFPIGCDGEKTSENGAVVRTIQGGGHSGGLHSRMTGIAHAVRSGGRGSLDRHAWDTIMIHNVYGGFGEGKPRVFTDISPTIRTPKGGGHLPMVVQPCLTPDRPKKRQHGRRFKEDGEPMFTLTGQDVHGIALNSKIRRLTPTECERLQGFPDGWTEGISDTQRYKCLGNAVTVNVIEYLGLLLS